MIEKVIKNIIENIFHPTEIKIMRIILFGSRARGEDKKDSDWDILIITEKNLFREEKVKLGHLIRKELAKELIPCDV